MGRGRTVDDRDVTLFVGRQRFAAGQLVIEHRQVSFGYLALIRDTALQALLQDTFRSLHIENREWDARPISHGAQLVALVSFW